MPDRPIIDHDVLIRKEIDLRMKPLIIANFQGQEKIDKKLDGVVKLLKELHDARIHNLIQDVLLAVLFIGMVILFRTT